jgi:hypothetical protein
MPHEMPAATSQMSPGLGKESLFPFEIVHPNLVEHKELGMYRHASVQSRAFESPAPIPVVEKKKRERRLLRSCHYSHTGGGPVLHMDF